MNTQPEIDTVLPAVCYATMKNIFIEAGVDFLRARLQIPPLAKGIVVFGQIASPSPEVCQFAKLLEQAGLGTLLVELLAPKEQGADAVVKRCCDNVDLLAARLVAAVRCLRHNPYLRGSHLGLFGWGFVGSAILDAGAYLGQEVEAIVICDSHFDFGCNSFSHRATPTLLITIQTDIGTLCSPSAEIVLFDSDGVFLAMPGASHGGQLTLLKTIARRTARWFYAHWNLPFVPSVLDTLAADEIGEMVSH